VAVASAASYVEIVCTLLFFMTYYSCTLLQQHTDNHAGVSLLNFYRLVSSCFPRAKLDNVAGQNFWYIFEYR